MMNGSRRLGSEWKQEIGKVAIVLRRSETDYTTLEEESRV